MSGDLFRTVTVASGTSSKKRQAYIPGEGQGGAVTPARKTNFFF